MDRWWVLEDFTAPPTSERVIPAAPRFTRETSTSDSKTYSPSDATHRIARVESPDQRDQADTCTDDADRGLLNRSLCAFRIPLA
jgi:hypothetical protein